jgi:hypothetical protein
MSSLASIERWSRACEAMGVASPERGYRGLRRAWQGTGVNHTLNHHLDACVRELVP